MTTAEKIYAMYSEGRAIEDIAKDFKIDPARAMMLVSKQRRIESSLARRR